MKKVQKGPFNTGHVNPEKYIRAQARSLPIAECVITADWQTSGICSVIVARRHKTGNFTVGFYLIDLYCLGLKDTSYKFSISPDEYDYLKKSGPAKKKCDYVFAHNMIYGGIAFAEDYGFKPHKDFAITKFLLEEDDERVELMDIDFGLNGIPCYMRGPYDGAAKIRNITATLERMAGPGNYSIIDAPGGFSFNEDEEDEEDDFFDNDEEYNPLLAVYEKVSEEYDELVRTGPAKEALDNSPIATGYELTGEAMETEYVRYDSEMEAEEYNRVHQMIIEGKNIPKAIKKIKEAISKYPGKPLFYNLLQSAYLYDGQEDKSDEIIYQMNQLFPGYLFSKVAYANLLIDEKRLDEVLPVFENKTDLNDLYPDRQLFHKTEASAFFGTMCRYFIAVDNVDAADTYMNAILKYRLITIPGQTIAEKAITDLCKLKMDKLKEAEKLNMT